jgi:hypothetical protein
MTDRKSLYRNGFFKRDGQLPRDGWRVIGHDIIPPFFFFSAETELFPVGDVYPTVVKKAMADIHVNSVRRDGSRPRDGRLQRSNLLDWSSMRYTTGTMIDQARGLLRRDGMIKRDGSEDRSGLGRKSIYDKGSSLLHLGTMSDPVTASDTAKVEIKNDAADMFKNTRKRDGSLLRDGSVPRSNYIIDVSSAQCGFAITFQEVLQAADEFTVGMRNHHFRDGTYLRDGSIKRDSMMLIPLE